jgi:phosphatidylserine/phosphatidylglycerophosphate/cardiolipin synthase-like enzyme
MKLIVEPDDGLTPLLTAVRRARKSIEMVVFRFDRIELEKALATAVARGVSVRALIAHTNGGGQKQLRKLELRLLEAGVTVSRTADDLRRYHGKMTLVDDMLYVLGFNYTRLDVEQSRSFGIVTRDKKLVADARALFDADSTRQPYGAGDKRLVVSPETARGRLTAFIQGAKQQLLIYDDRLSDRLMLRLLRQRLDAGVEIRVIGRITKNADRIPTCKPPDLRLHVRAIIRDGVSAFVGSQSLRKPELDTRREIGILVNDSRIARKLKAVFETDWEAGSKDERDTDTATSLAAAG